VPPESSDPADRFEQLERRVRTLEARLGIDQPAPAPPTIFPETHPDPAPPTKPRPKLPAPRMPAPRRAAKPSAPKSPIDVERLIGGRWFAAAGAVVVVIGVGLFLKLAFDRGWLNLIPPLGKCISGAAFGAILLIAGEFIRRRLGALASAGVSAAGLGALFASVYAAFGVYQLIGPAPALVLLAAVCVVGFGVAALSRLVSIAVLSLVAAYLSPLVIGEARGAPLVLPIYLFSLLSMGLALSAWRAIPFRILRGLVWWGTLAFGTLWTITDGLGSPGAAIAFVALCWAALHVELALSSRRPRGAPIPSIVPELPWPAARFIATSFSTTAWSIGLAVYILRQATQTADWMAPAIGAAAAATVAAILAGRLRVLRDVPRTDAQRLGAGLAMQAGALLMAAIALGLAGWTESVAWLSLGIAAVATGRWIRSRALDVYGLVALAVGTGRLLIVDSAITTPPHLLASAAGLMVSRWTLVMVIAAAAWAAAAAILRRRPHPDPASPTDTNPWTIITRAVTIVAMCHLNAALLVPGADGQSVAAAWLVLGIAGLCLARALVSPALGTYGVAVLALSSLRFLADAPMLSANPGAAPTIAGIVINRWMGLMLGAAAAWAMAAALAPAWGRSSHSPLRRSLGISGLVIAMTMVSLCLVHPNADAGAVCIVWLLLGIAGLLVGRRLRSFGLPAYGVIMLAAASARFLYGSPLTGAHEPPLATSLGLVITRWTLLMLAGAAAWFVGSAIVRDEPPIPPGAEPPVLARTALVGIALAMVYAAAADPRAQLGSLSMAWLVIAAAAILVHRILPRISLDIGGLVGIALAAGAWAVAYPADWMASRAPSLMHPGFWVSFALAAAALAARSWLRRSKPTVPASLQLIIPAALALMFVSSSLELARVAGNLASDPTVRKAAVSIWWGVYAVALILGGFARRVAPARHIGLALLATATIKTLAYDLSNVQGIWRVASVIGLGLLMLGVAVGYAKAASRIRTPTDPIN